MITVEALLFDLDGTLIDSKRDLYLSVRHLQSSMGRPMSSEDEVASFVGDGAVKLVERALPGVEGRALEEAVEAFKRHYREHCLDHTRLYPGVAETLAHFRDKKMAIVTNKPVRISKHMLEVLGISKLFQTVVGGDSLATKKPDPEPVTHALQEIGVVSARAAIVVGDSPNDVLAGRLAGTYTCGIQSNIGDFERLRQSAPDFMLTRFNDLVKIVT